MMQIGIVIAVYNRPHELHELLLSLYQQTDHNFKVCIIDDGSTVPLYPVCDNFPSLDLEYHKITNRGPGKARNFGVNKIQSEWVIFIDSDVILDYDYIARCKENINNIHCDAFGGADKASKSFNVIQQAISFSMTSFLTTGGIRGSKKSLDKFQPRSFNMGVKRDAFLAIGGFSDLRIGEDPDLSMRLWENGSTTAFFPNIAVNHKRRNSISSFSKQVYNFGIARPILNQRHPGYTKFTFAFPSLFLIGYIGALVLYFISKSSLLLIPYGLYSIMLTISALISTKNFSVAILSPLIAFIQLFSYGFGFLLSWVTLEFLKKDPRKAFPGHFS